MVVHSVLSNILVYSVFPRVGWNSPDRAYLPRSIRQPLPLGRHFKGPWTVHSIPTDTFVVHSVLPSID